MKILQIHNEYQTLGGEEVVLNAERSVLEANGHEVQQWIARSSEIQELSSAQKLRVSLDSVWSHNVYSQIKIFLQEHRPNVAHIHNTVPLISPSVYAACQSEGVPVVQTLHNFKLVCPGSNLYRDNQVCEKCIGKSFTYPALIHGCYRRDYLSTAFLVSSLTFNRMRGTYSKEIDTYIALTEFARKKFIEAGLPSEKLVMKPNFVTAQIGKGSHQGGYALFAGRLISQKGVETLLQAWSLLDESVPLKIAGTGYLAEQIQSQLPNNVEYLGQLPRQEVISLMQNATFLVFPSEWYEGFPMTIVEAFATGLPVIASRLGGMAEIVQAGTSGWHFESGNPQDLAAVVQQAWRDLQEVKRRGELARVQYEELYSPEQNYQMLLNIYQKVLKTKDADEVCTDLVLERTNV
ncbi:MAG: glycosyltransferase [Cyanobacteria bacterium J06636_16]